MEHLLAKIESWMESLGEVRMHICRARNFNYYYLQTPLGFPPRRGGYTGWPIWNICIAGANVDWM